MAVIELMRRFMHGKKLNFLLVCLQKTLFIDVSCVGTNAILVAKTFTWADPHFGGQIMRGQKLNLPTQVIALA